MLGIEQMRAELFKQYPGEKWYNKVRKMPDGQVYAIYMRMLESHSLGGGDNCGSRRPEARRQGGPIKAYY